MSEMSDYLEDELIKHLFRTGSFTKPTVLGIALLTTNAVDADTGQFTTGTGVEVANAGAYARQDVPPLDANWSAPSAGNGITKNVAPVTFPQATANWGTIAAMAICDSITYDAGNMLMYSAVDTARAIDNGDTAEFAADSIIVTFA
jgi:hypothetical protein